MLHFHIPTFNNESNVTLVTTFTSMFLHSSVQFLGKLYVPDSDFMMLRGWLYNVNLGTHGLYMF